MGQAESYPGDFKKFILTFIALYPEYNGAWWFFTTYIILVLLSPIINKIVVKYNTILVISISFMFYLIAYVQRIKEVIVLDNNILNLKWAPLSRHSKKYCCKIAGKNIMNQ